MKNRILSTFVRTGLGLVVTACLAEFPAAALAASRSTAQPHFTKVVMMVFENASYRSVISNSDFANLAAHGALMTNFSAETHPSLPNYIAMISGSTHGLFTDSSVDLNGTNLADLLEAHHLDWRVYAENYPGNCFTGDQSGNYARKHNPFMNFADISQNPQRCAKIVNGSQFFTDFKAKTLPAFSFFVPNLLDDGHDTSVRYAGRWLTSKFGAILSNPAKLKNMLFVITFDEGDFFGSNQIYTLLIGGSVKPGVQDDQQLDHYSILKTIETQFGLGSIERNDQSASVITGIWN